MNLFIFLCSRKRKEITKKNEKKRKSFENLKKWIQWSRLKWDDVGKIEFEKNYTKVKNIVGKKLKKNILIKIKNKYEFFHFLYLRKKKLKRKKIKKKKEKKKEIIWKFEKVNTL